MGKFTVFFVVLVLGVLALFSIANNDATSITVPFGKTYEIPKIGLILVSSLTGALLALVVFVVRDTRRFFLTYQFQKKKKQEEVIQGLYSKAVNAILAEHDEEARLLLEEILRENPEHVDALLRLGDIAAGKGDLEGAEAHYRNALAASPKNLRGMISLARVFEKTNRWADALDRLEDILEEDPDNLTALHEKRDVIERDGKWDEVIEVQKTITKYVRDEEQRRGEDAALTGYRYELAREGLEKGDFEKASRGFRAILREDKGFVPAYLGVAEVMLGENDTEAAVGFLEKGYEQTGSMIMLARLEDILIGAGEPTRLIRIYKKAVSERPRDDTLKFFLGKLYYRLEMVDDALDALSSLDSPKGMPDLHRLMGELYLRRNECERAVLEFKKTLDTKRALRLPYCCGSCGRTEPEWAGRCSGCRSWNTFRFNIYGACEI